MGRKTGLNPTFRLPDLKKYMTERLDEVDMALISELQIIGEQVINHARDLRPPVSFTDRTGNLRASIGYGIYVNGRPYQMNFRGGIPGNLSEETADKVGAEHPEGISLVVVAGMNYAYYVEATNRDVLTSAERLAKELVPKMLKQLLESF